MKKIIISLLLIAACFTGRAQIGTDFGVNMFMNMGGGVSMYQYADNPLHTGFSGGISVGKWILSPLAARITLDFQTLSKLAHQRLPHDRPRRVPAYGACH